MAFSHRNFSHIYNRLDGFNVPYAVLRYIFRNHTNVCIKQQSYVILLLESDGR